MNVLELKNLKVIFPSMRGIVRAVEGVDICIKKGECLALVGESGCGKSITSLAAMKLLPDTAVSRVDSHKIAGVDITKCSEKELQEIRGKKIAIVFQDALSALNPVMPVGKQIEEVFLCHTDMSKEEAKEKAIEALASVGIPNPEIRSKDYPHELSGGMRQRVLIAMAFSCNPDVIIADEPTTALDVTIQAQVLELLSKLQKERNTALLLITHDLSVVRHMADRIAVMYSGKIVEEAPAKELFEHPMHPYTKGLMASVATLDRKEGPFVQIAGSLPDPADKPEGCYFHPRCKDAKKGCEQGMPRLREVSSGHKVRCYLGEV